MFSSHVLQHLACSKDFFLRRRYDCCNPIFNVTPFRCLIGNLSFKHGNLGAGSEYVCLRDAGHIANVEAPAAFNAAVLDFLRRRFPAAG